MSDEGMLELVSLTGNVITDEENEYYHHTHAVFSFKKDGILGLQVNNHRVDSLHSAIGSYEPVALLFSHCQNGTATASL